MKKYINCTVVWITYSVFHYGQWYLEMDITIFRSFRFHKIKRAVVFVGQFLKCSLKVECIHHFTHDRLLVPDSSSVNDVIKLIQKMPKLCVFLSHYACNKIFQSSRLKFCEIKLYILESKRFEYSIIKDKEYKSVTS